MFKISLIGVIAILIFSCTTATLTTHQTQGIIQLGPGIKMDRGEFGFLYFSEDGSVFFYESKDVPLEEDIFFGWRIRLITDKEKVIWKEEFIVPEPPTVWGYGHGTEFDEQGKIATTEKTVSLKDGWIGHGWFVAAGDPPGTYIMKIYVDGALAKTFSFRLE